MFFNVGVAHSVRAKLVKGLTEANGLTRCYARYSCNVKRQICSKPKLTQVTATCSLAGQARHKFHGANFNKSNSNGTAPVVLGGILSFLGLQKPEEKEPVLITTIKMGILSVSRREYEKAERYFHKALEMAQDDKDEDGITYAYDMLANLAFETQQYDKAEKLFVSVLQRIIAKGEAQDSNAVVDISLKLAKIFESRKEYGKAEQGYQFCIESLEKRLENNDDNDDNSLALWGMSMDWYARFLLGVNRKPEALKCFEKAYDMCVRVNGLNHEQTVVLLNDLGTVSSLMGDTDSALSYFEKAKSIGKSLPEMKDLASIYINLGQLYLLREMYKESKMACQEGMRMARTVDDKTAVSEAKQCLDEVNKVIKSSVNSKDLKPSVQVLAN